MPRRKPYTQTGVRRLKCARCKARTAEMQWEMKMCALGGSKMYLPLCIACDVELNRVTLEWVGVEDVPAVIAAYEEKLGVRQMLQPEPAAKDQA